MNRIARQVSAGRLVRAGLVVTWVAMFAGHVVGFRLAGKIMQDWKIEQDGSVTHRTELSVDTELSNP